MTQIEQTIGEIEKYISSTTTTPDLISIDEIPLSIFKLKLFPMESFIDVNAINILNTEMDTMIRQATDFPEYIVFTTVLISQALIAKEDKKSAVIFLRKVAKFTSTKKDSPYENSFVREDLLNTAIALPFDSDIKLDELAAKLLSSSSDVLRNISKIEFQIVEDDTLKSEHNEAIAKGSSLTARLEPLPTASMFFM
eukprot:CAMPEP_0194350470 /NCGR_PEP_ID=MMETSP0171-20130528/107658_1 /TAXON_ID=218684 /ORGANISM="Corethron pennatum, Strain L29A3" /LENGTH=195 /DNA_ID=CAMNT_0039118021 /DNA_START=935 /DNA_END=1519 /DNA_ORIENTATION=-